MVKTLIKGWHGSNDTINFLFIAVNESMDLVVIDGYQYWMAN